MVAPRGDRKRLRATIVDSRKAKGRRRIGGEMGTQYEPELEPELEGKGRTGWVVGIMGQRQETPRWVNELV